MLRKVRDALTVDDIVEEMRDRRRASDLADDASIIAAEVVAMIDDNLEAAGHMATAATRFVVISELFAHWRDG